MVDYLIIGSGLAGISFSEIALHNHKSILVIDNNSQNSSKIAGGLYNPVAKACFILFCLVVHSKLEKWLLDLSQSIWFTSKYQWGFSIK